MMCATDTKEGLTTSITIGCLSFVQASCDNYSAKIFAVQDLNLRPIDLQSFTLPTVLLGVGTKPLGHPSSV